MDPQQKSKLLRADREWDRLESESERTTLNAQGKLKLEGEVRSSVLKIEVQHEQTRFLAAASAVSTAVPPTAPDNQDDKTAQPPPSTGQLSQPQTDASQK